MLLRGRGTNYTSIVATRSLNTAQSQNDEPTALLVGSGCFLQCCLTLHRFIAKPFRLFSPALEIRSVATGPQAGQMRCALARAHGEDLCAGQLHAGCDCGRTRPAAHWG